MATEYTPFSPLGKRSYLPQGVFAVSVLASEEAMAPIKAQYEQLHTEPDILPPSTASCPALRRRF